LFLRYVGARAIDHSETMAFRYYIADALQILTENTAKSERSYITVSLRDILTKKNKKESPEEVVERLRRKFEEA